MPPKGGKVFNLEIVDEAERIDALIQESQDKLVLIDCHMGWCGPCDALSPTLSKLMNDFDRADERLAFASANLDKYAERLQATLPEENSPTLEKNGCLPVFLAYRFGSCIGIIQGVDGPALQDLVEINIPALDAGAE